MNNFCFVVSKVPLATGSWNVGGLGAIAAATTACAALGGYLTAVLARRGSALFGGWHTELRR